MIYMKPKLSVWAIAYLYYTIYHYYYLFYINIYLIT